MSFEWLWRVNVVSSTVTNAPLWWGFIMGEAIPSGDRGIWEISAASAQLCCETKTALKNKVH